MDVDLISINPRETIAAWDANEQSYFLQAFCEFLEDFGDVSSVSHLGNSFAYKNVVKYFRNGEYVELQAGKELSHI